MILGDRIKSLLAERGMSQAELARSVGVTQPTIAHLVSGRSSGSSHIHKIARVLRTTPAYLAGEIDDPAQDAPPPPPPAVITARLEVTLGSEEALTAMFEGLLAGLDPKAPRAAQARLLAQKLPIALSSLRDLRVVTEARRDRSEASPEADAHLAIANPAPRP